MAEWYFDIETEGPDPRQAKVITIQYQAIGAEGTPGAFQVLAEWEWGEKQILRSIVEKGILEPTSEFVPLGDDLRFEISFLIERAERQGIREFTADELRHFWLTKPMIDLGPILQALGSGSATGPVARGAIARGGTTVADLYRAGRYQEIIDRLTRKKDWVIAVANETGPALRELGGRSPEPNRTP